MRCKKKMKDEGGGVGSTLIIIGLSISEFTDGTTIVDVLSPLVYALFSVTQSHPISQFSEIRNTAAILYRVGLQTDLCVDQPRGRRKRKLVHCSTS